MDSQEDMVYPNDPKAKIKIDDDLKELFRGIELPRDMVDIEKELQKNGMKPMTDTTKRRAAAQIHGVKPKAKPKKKQRGMTKRTKLTNAHLPELFQHL
jgi:transcription initiation factor TFIIE subunit beta